MNQNSGHNVNADTQVYAYISLNNMCLHMHQAQVLVALHRWLVNSKLNIRAETRTFSANRFFQNIKCVLKLMF